MQMTFLKKLAFGAMALGACVALSPAYAEDDEEAKPAAEGEAAEGLPDMAAKPEKFFFPLVRCRLIDGCSVTVQKPQASNWTVAEEGRYYPLGSTFRVEPAANAAAKAEFAFGGKAVLKATNAVEFATEEIEIGGASRAVLLKNGRFSLDLPRTLPDGLFAVKAPFFACMNLAGESLFTYSPTGDGDEAVVRCVTGSMALEGRHYKIAQMRAANQVRIRTTNDNLFTSLRGESGDYVVTLDQGLVQDKNFETGEVKDVPKTLDFSLSPQCAIKIFRRKAAVADRMIVSMMTFNPSGYILNRCAFAENRANVNSGELVVPDSIPMDASEKKGGKGESKAKDADAEAEAVESVDAKQDDAAAPAEEKEEKKSGDSDI